MAYDVFISYSNKDKLIADAICSNLENAGVRCWIAPRDIEPGADWPTAISLAIKISKIMVLIFSHNSNHSNDVGRELILAANNNLIIVPFKIDNIEPEPGKQYYLARTHWLEAMNPPTQEQINKLVKHVKGFLVNLGIEPIPIASVEYDTIEKDEKDHQEKPKSKRPWLTIGIIIVFLLITISALFIPQSPLSIVGARLNQSTIITDTVSPTYSGNEIAMLTSTLELVQSEISTETPEFVQTEEPSPTSTIIAEPSWVADFAEPYLEMIEYVDGDAGTWGNGYPVWWMDSDCSSEDIIYNSDSSTISNCEMSWNLWFTDFVVSMEVQIPPSDDNLDNQNGLGFFFRGANSYGFDYDGRVEIFYFQDRKRERVEIPDTIWNAGEFNTIIIIVSEYETALFVNGSPIYYGEMPEEWKGGIAGWSVRDSTVTFKGIGIWDLNKIR